MENLSCLNEIVAYSQPSIWPHGMFGLENCIVHYTEGVVRVIDI